MKIAPKIASFFEHNRPHTPCLILDLDAVETKYKEMAELMPEAKIYYAIKSNPARPILDAVGYLGSNFDTASLQETQDVLDTGVNPDRISFGSTIKKEREILETYSRGVRMFAFDSEAELGKLAKLAPGSRVFCRLLVETASADWPLEHKFGCDFDMCVALMIQAKELGLEPYGISFHVGSQQRDPSQWDVALKEVARVFAALEPYGIQPKMINLGGGFPARYRSAVPALNSYITAIKASLATHFKGKKLDLILEPGRGLVGDAGVIFSEVILISKKSAKDEKRWVYIDVGKFGGLAETMDECIKYPLVTARDGGPTGPVILAGPSCDSADIMYQNFAPQLPLALQIGDWVAILGTGAYTTTYASIGFNGFKPLVEYYI